MEASSTGKARRSRRLSTAIGSVAAAIDWLEVASLIAGISLLAIALIANVVARLFFDSIYFIEEISEFLIIFITFVGLSYAARRARHIRMGAFLDLMPAVVEKAMIFVISSVSALVMFVMAYHAFEYLLEVRRMEQTTSALRLPYWYSMIIIPIGFLSAGLQYVRTFVKNVREREVWLSSDQRSEYEELIEEDERS